MAPLAPPEVVDPPLPPDDPIPTALFTVAPPTDPAGSRWAVGGVTWDPPGGCSTATRWAACSGATLPVTGPPAAPTFRPFQAVVGYQCSTVGFPQDPGRYARHAEEALTRHVTTQVEAELWTGTLALANGWESPYLADGDATLVDTGTLLPYADGVARLVGELRGCLGQHRGVLHMAPHVVVRLIRVGLLRVVEGRIETVFGDAVVAGGGYLGGGATGNTVYTVTTTGSSSGSFTLTVTNPASGTTETTTAIAYNASATAVVNALAALSFIGPTDVTATGGPLPGAVAVTFTGDLAGNDLTVTGTSTLTGGSLGVVHTTTGGSVPDSTFDSTWVYATGALLTRAGPVEITPTETRDIDLATNTVTVFAERTVLAGFDTCCHLAVHIDLTDAGDGAGSGSSVGTGGVDGGGA